MSRVIADDCGVLCWSLLLSAPDTLEGCVRPIQFWFGVRARDVLEAPQLVVRHAAGSERLGETLRDGMKEKYELKVRGVPGGEWRVQFEVTKSTGGSVGRTMRLRTMPIWSTSGSSWRAMGCSRTPAGWSVEDVGDLPEQLGPDDARRFRALAARANYFSQDVQKRRQGGSSTHGSSYAGRLGKIEAVGSLLAPVSLALVDV